jgi:glycosyltransferase involved in cell wall biosynthesis
MARLLLSASERVYVSVPAWEELLRPWAPRGVRPACWLPIPSTVPRVEAADAVGALRARLTGPVLGHFGTFGREVAGLLEPPLLAALHRTGATALLLGRGADRFARGLGERHPSLRERLVARDDASPAELSMHLQAMDVALQPYADGSTSRRTTLMAALSHGVAVASALGRYSEAVWRDADLGFPSSTAGLADRTIQLLGDAAERTRVASAGAALYRRRFALEHTLDALLEEGA